MVYMLTTMLDGRGNNSKHHRLNTRYHNNKTEKYDSPPLNIHRQGFVRKMAIMFPSVQQINDSFVRALLLSRAVSNLE